ncbi:MAG: dTMP kinase [Halobacteria archaeon]|nr:dTMP kinase [Halobacteria archaeon]
MLVTLEGIDGAGKSTVVERLDEVFSDAVFTREPTDSWMGEAVTESVEGERDLSSMAEFFLFVADHAQHVDRVIDPSLEEGSLVISDRYIDSRRAYQAVSLEDEVESPLEWIRSVHDAWTVYPDLTLLLDIDPETAIERTHATAKYEKTEFLEKVRENYIDIASDEDRFVVVDAERPVDEVVDDCRHVIESRL